MAKIPFNWMPWAWGMKGRTREEAQVDYYYEGEERDYKRLEIALKYDYDNNPNHPEYRKRLILLDKKFGKKTEEECEYELLDVKLEDNYNKDPNNKDYRLEKLDLDYKYKKIDDIEYRKTKADILGEPYVEQISEYHPSKGLSGLGIELVWNKKFIELLQENGYQGLTEEDLVRKWFAELCYQAAIEEGIVEDVYGDAFLMESNVLKRGQVGPVIDKQSTDDGKSEYS